MSSMTGGNESVKQLHSMQYHRLTRTFLLDAVIDGRYTRRWKQRIQEEYTWMMWGVRGAYDHMRQQSSALCTRMFALHKLVELSEQLFIACILIVKLLNSLDMHCSRSSEASHHVVVYTRMLEQRFERWLQPALVTQQQVHNIGSAWFLLRLC